jgi:hypothetical protein
MRQQRGPGHGATLHTALRSRDFPREKEPLKAFKKKGEKVVGKQNVPNYERLCSRTIQRQQEQDKSRTDWQRQKVCSHF